MRPWSDYANQPLHETLARSLMPELRGFLRERLPQAMIPSVFVFMHNLPQTPSGKVDRQALLMRSHAGHEFNALRAAPRTAIERALVSIYGEILADGSVGIHDNFFTELGGHSLLATRLVSRIRDTFQIELPLRTVFDNPTVASLAQIVESAQPRQCTNSISVVRLPRESQSAAAPREEELDP